MPQIDSNTLDVALVQQALDNGSDVTSTGMIGLAIWFLVVLVFILFFAIVIYNASRVREEKMSAEDIALIVKRILMAIAFFIISFLLIGVFYVF